VRKDFFEKQIQPLGLQAKGVHVLFAFHTFATRLLFKEGKVGDLPGGHRPWLMFHLTLFTLASLYTQAFWFPLMTLVSNIGDLLETPDEMGALPY
jgi:hypothetical protein